MQPRWAGHTPDGRLRQTRPRRVRVTTVILVSLLGFAVVVAGLLVGLALVGRNPLDLLARDTDPGQPRAIGSRQMAELAAETSPTTLVRGPEDGAFFIDDRTGSVWRVNLKAGKAVEIITPGDRPAGSDDAIGTPVQLTAAGPDVVVVDDAGRAWRWQPSNRKGAGKLARLRLQGEPTLPQGHGPVAAFGSEVGQYRLYVADRSGDQILRYQQTFDGSSFQPPSPYLERSETVTGDVKQLYLDFDLYTLADGEPQRYSYGRRDWMWMPDDVGGTDYRLLGGSGTSSNAGRLYLYDAAGPQIIGMAKADGSILGRWTPDVGSSALDDVRGMYVVEGGVSKKGKRKADTLVWITPDAIHRAKLGLPVDG